MAIFGTVVPGETFGFRNRIINGDMRINQRGTTSGITSGYFVDRWNLSGCSTSSTLSSSLPSGFVAGISISATSGNPIAIQKIESKNCSDLSGQNVTLSFYAKNISNATTLYASLAYADSVDSFGSTTTISEQNLGTLTSEWVKYSYTWTSLPSGSTNGLSVSILCAGSGTFSMGITGVQLEVGSVATPFERRPYGMELSLCQRYFAKLNNDGTGGDIAIAQGGQQSTTGAYFTVIYPVTMRAEPTVTVSSLEVSDYLSFQSAFTLVSSGAGFNTCAIFGTFSTNGAAYRAIGLRIIFNTSGFLSLSAEL